MILRRVNLLSFLHCGHTKSCMICVFKVFVLNGFGKMAPKDLIGFENKTVNHALLTHAMAARGRTYAREALVESVVEGH